MKKLILILFLAIPLACLAQGPVLKIHFIDIGEGEAILIQVEDNNLLIDTGGITAKDKLNNYLKANKVGSIGHLIITHPDFDHICGLFSITPEFGIQNRYDNGARLDACGDSVYACYQEIFRSGKNYRALRTGDSLKLGGLKLKVIWPADRALAGSFNHNSLVIMLSYQGFRCLLTGDIDNLAEAELLKMGANLKAEVLKVAHHGAQDASSGDFLERVNPRVAIISVDSNNKQGYPQGPALDLLAAKNIKTYRTDRNGSIVITVAGRNNYYVNTEK